MRKFLIECLLLALLVGVPTVVIWQRPHRRLTLKDAYVRSLLHVARVFSVAYMLVLGLILVFALSDLVGIGQFGYPSYSVLVVAVGIMIGYALWRLASRWLSWHVSKVEREGFR